jgi:hypothetical protein
LETEEEDRVSTTIWSGGAAVVHTHYPGALGFREWIRVILSWPLISILLIARLTLSDGELGRGRCRRSRCRRSIALTSAQILVCIVISHVHG